MPLTRIDKRVHFCLTTLTRIDKTVHFCLTTLTRIDKTRAVWVSYQLGEGGGEWHV